MSEEKKNLVKGQAKFLRALCYYNLVTYWGNVPLFTSYAEVATAIRAKSPAADIWALIIQDCKDATKLPTRSGWGETQYGRITSGVKLINLKEKDKVASVAKVRKASAEIDGEQVEISDGEEPESEASDNLEES